MFINNVLWLAISRTIIVLATLANISFSTSLLGTAQYALLGLALLAHSLMAMFFVNPAGQYINRHLVKWWDSGELFLRLYQFGLYVTAVGLLTFVASLLYWVLNGFSDVLLSAVLVTLLLCIATWNATLVPALNILGWPKVCICLQVLAPTLGLAISLGLSHDRPTANTWLAGQILGLLVSAAIAHACLWRHRKHSLVTTYSSFISRQSFMQFSAPLSLVAGLMWFQWNGWKPFVQSVYGLEILGVMLSGYMLASYLWATVEGLAHQALHPFFFTQLTDSAQNSKQSFTDFTDLLIPLYFYLAVIALIASPLVAFILPGNFVGAQQYFVWGVGIELLRAIAAILAHAIHLKLDSRFLLMPYFSVIVVLFFLFLFSAFGLKLEPAFILFSLLIASVFLLILISFKIKDNLKIARIFKDSKYLIALFFIAFIGTNTFHLNEKFDALFYICTALFTLTSTVVFAAQIKALRTVYLRFSSTKP
jgi:O-antigen/teichoic acid export membrane protein